MDDYVSFIMEVNLSVGCFCFSAPSSLVRTRIIYSLPGEGLVTLFMLSYDLISICSSICTTTHHHTPFSQFMETTLSSSEISFVSNDSQTREARARAPEKRNTTMNYGKKQIETNKTMNSGAL